MDKQKQNLEEKVQILGHEIDINAIENPHLRRILRSTRLNQFLFSRFFYGDHRDHTEEPQHHSEYSDYSDTNHTDYRDYREEYNEYKYSDHTDWP